MDYLCHKVTSHINSYYDTDRRCICGLQNVHGVEKCTEDSISSRIDVKRALHVGK